MKLYSFWKTFFFVNIENRSKNRRWFRSINQSNVSMKSINLWSKMQCIWDLIVKKNLVKNMKTYNSWSNSNESTSNSIIFKTIHQVNKQSRIQSIKNFVSTTISNFIDNINICDFFSEIFSHTPNNIFSFFFHFHNFDYDVCLIFLSCFFLLSNSIRLTISMLLWKNRVMQNHDKWWSC